MEEEKTPFSSLDFTRKPTGAFGDHPCFYTRDGSGLSSVPMMADAYVFDPVHDFESDDEHDNPCPPTSPKSMALPVRPPAPRQRLRSRSCPDALVQALFEENMPVTWNKHKTKQVSALMPARQGTKAAKLLGEKSVVSNDGTRVLFVDRRHFGGLQAA